MARKLKVTQVKSRIGLPPSHRATLRALGLRKIRQTVEHDDTQRVVAGNLVIYAFGLPWLMATVDVGLAAGLELGVTPFLAGDALKILLAAGLLPGAWALVGRDRE